MPRQKPSNIILYVLPQMACHECEMMLDQEALKSSQLGRKFTILVRGGHLPTCSHYKRVYKVAVPLQTAEYVTEEA